MSRHALLALALSVGLAGCTRGEAAKDGVATDDGIAAIALPEQQLRQMLKRSFLGTQSGPMHLYALGLEQGCEVLDEAVDGAVQQHLPKWRENLIVSYRENVPADELAEAVERSPHRAQAALRSYLPAVSNAMKQRSQSLLQTSSVEVLQVTGAAASKIDPASIDLAERRKELAQATSSGKICDIGK